MECRPLHMTLISAEGLKNVNLFSRMDVYAEVSIAGYPRSAQRTPVHRRCGTRPTWNHRLQFVVDEPYLSRPGLSLLFVLKAASSFAADKAVGSAAVPVDELFNSNSRVDSEKVVEYQVRTKSGKPKGLIRFSYRFGEKFVPQAAPAEPVTAYPAYAGGSGYPPHPYPPALASGYGYQAPPPAGYGYPAMGYGQAPPQKVRKNRMGGGLGLGLGAGLLGGFLIGDAIGDAAAYSDGYGDAMGDMGDMGGGFDF